MKKTWTLVVCLVVTTAVLYAMAGALWGSAGNRTIIRRIIPEATQTAPAGTPRLKLDAPMPGTSITEILVPRELYDMAVEGDTLAYRILRLPIFGTDVIDFELKRAGLVAHRWSEGRPFFIAALAIEGIVGGLVLTGLVLWAFSVIRNAGAPKR